MSGWHDHPAQPPARRTKSGGAGCTTTRARALAPRLEGPRRGGLTPLATPTPRQSHDRQGGSRPLSRGRQA
jgi:hypothetical protein